MYNFYLFCLFFMALVGGGLTVVTWRTQQTVTARLFSIMMVPTSWWALCAGLAAISNTAETAVFLGNTLRFTGVILVSPLVFLFALAYTNHIQWLNRRRLIFFLAVPVASLLLNWTGSQHNLFVYDVVYTEVNGIWLRDSWQQGIWFQIIYTPYSYLALLGTLVLIFQYAWRSRYPYRQQAWLVFAGTLLPIATSFIPTFNLLPGPDLDLIVLSFLFMELTFAWSLFQYQLLDMMPIARDAVVEHMNDAVIAIDNQNRIVDINPAVEQTLNVTRQEVIGRPASQLFTQWPDLFQQYSQVNETAVVIPIPTTTGRLYLDVRISPLLEREQPIGRLIVWRDITQLKETEAALQTTLQKTETLYRIAQSVSDFFRLNELLQSLVDTVAQALPADRVTLISFDWEQENVTDFVRGGPGVANVTKVTYDELMEGLSGWVLRESKAALSLKGEPDSRESPAVQQRRRETNCGAIIVVPLQYRRQLLGTLTAINRLDQPDFTGQDVQLMESMAGQIATAIENARLYTSEQQKVKALQESNQALEAFSFIVAHDLKSPLSAIAGFTELIQIDRGKESFSEGDLDRYLNYIAGSARKMNDIISNLLMLARIQRAQDVPLEKLDMGQIVTETCNRLSWQIKDNQAEIQLPDAWPVAWGNPTWVEEVWANYISNAIKYGGKPPQIRLGADELENGLVSFWVQDNGAGLTDKQQEVLFTEFSRLGTHNVEGHGLGLAIVKRIVEQQGGQVGVKSHPGAGSNFFFSLPKHGSKKGEKQEEQTPLLEQPHPDQNFSRRWPLRILLVEDNAINQILATRILENLGYQLEVVNDGLEAVTALHEKPYELILMDVHMPILDGLAATRRIRQELPPDKQPYIVALTAANSLEEQQNYLRAGMDDHIGKPFQMAEITAVLQRAAKSRY